MLREVINHGFEAVYCACSADWVVVGFACDNEVEFAFGAKCGGGYSGNFAILCHLRKLFKSAN